MPEQFPPGYGVLLTRPLAQSLELANAIEQRGGTAFVFPSMEIVLRDEHDILRDVNALGAADITVFVSRNAVASGIAYAEGQLAAIGPTTAAEIVGAGHAVDICPTTGFDSEHLLAEPAFADVQGKTIRIIRGNGGRERLANELRARGAKVEYLTTYERRLPEHSAEVVNDLETRWHAGEIAAIVLMSVQSLECLKLLLSPLGRSQLGHTLVVTPASRVLKEVLSQFPDSPAVLCAGPRLNDIVDCLAATANSATRPT
ncbi:MAG TPA: uroporphyrinogen-III synthase [Woeseiaceae bacterium]|nr:uroporphyrinogen-III synthase [Woeseiaceae bacterium]